MPRKCTVCTHPQLEEINQALVNNGTFRDIAGRFNVSRSSLERHKADHLPEHLSQAKKASEVAQADDLLVQMRQLQQATLSILSRSYTRGDDKIALDAIRTARGNIEILGQLLGELQQAPVVNIVMMPEWVKLRTIILQALEPHKDARLAVVEALNAGAL